MVRRRDGGLRAVLDREPGHLEAARFFGVAIVESDRSARSVGVLARGARGGAVGLAMPSEPPEGLESFQRFGEKFRDLARCPLLCGGVFRPVALAREDHHIERLLGGHQRVDELS